MANTQIEGSCCTIIWHVDSFKISHKKQKVVKDIAALVNAKYSQEKPVLVTYGTVHKYLRMHLNFSQTGKVVISMKSYIGKILGGVLEDMTEVATNSAMSHLIQNSPDCIITAEILYLTKWARPDIIMVVVFLCTRVSSPDMDDWKKLTWCVNYL